MENGHHLMGTPGATGSPRSRFSRYLGHTQAFFRRLLNPWGAFPPPQPAISTAPRRSPTLPRSATSGGPWPFYWIAQGPAALALGSFGPLSVPEREHANATELDSSVLQSSLSVCFLPDVVQILDIAIDNDSSKI